MSPHSPDDPFGEISIARPEAHFPGRLPVDTLQPSIPPSFSRQNLPPRSPSLVSTLAVFLGFGLLIYLAASYFVLPYLIKSVATRALARQLDRPVTIGQVEFDPFALRLTLINGIIGPRLSDPTDKVDPIFSFSELTLNLEALSLPQRAIICRELSISQPFLHLVHDQEHGYNIATLLRDSIQANAGVPRQLSLGWLAAIIPTRYSINNIAISKGDILFNDLPTAKVHHLEGLNVRLPVIANINYQNGQIEPHFSAVVNGTPVELKGQAQMAEGPMTASLNLKMTKLDLAAYKEYLPPSLGIKALSGQADLDLNLLYAAAATPAEKLRLAGAITLRSVQETDEQGQFAVDAGLVKGWFAPFAKQFQVEEITLQHPVWEATAGPVSRWPALIGAILRPAADQQKGLPLSRLQITKGEIKGVSGTTPEQPGGWQEIDASINTTPAASADRGGQQQAFFALSAENPNASRISLQGSASTAPFVAKGLLVVNQVDILSLQDLWRARGLDLPVKRGRVEQVQANFSITLDPDDQRPLLLLDPLNIQAKDLRIEQHGQVVEIPLWQSEQGAFKPGDPTLHLGKVRLQQAKLTCRRQSSTGTWRTIISQPEGQEALPASFDLAALEMSNSSLLIENQGPPEVSLRLERLDLQVDQLDRHKANTLSAAAMLDDQYPVQATGTFSLAPFSAKLNIQASELPLALFQPILERYFASPLSGALGVEGTLGLPALDYQGQWSVASLSMAPISCRRLTGEGTSFVLRPLSLAVDRLNLESPALHLTAKSSGMPQLPALMQPGWQPALAAPEAAVSIKAIELSEGTLIYDLPGPAEPCPEPPCGGGVTISGQKIGGTLENFIVAKEQAIPFSFKGLLESSAEFQTQGTITPFASSPGLAMKSRIAGLPLTTLAPLLEPYWGFAIKGGVLDFDNQPTFADTLIQDSSRVALQGLSLGKPLEPAAIKAIGNTWQSLPLVQAMLQDAADTIKLTVPVDGRTDTGFTYQAGLKTFLNQLLLKATVSPMNLLGDSRQGASDTVEFPAGASRLDGDSEENVNALALLLQERPLLVVTISGFADNVEDTSALLNPSKAAKGRQASKDPVLITDKNLLALAGKRGQVVQKLLIERGVEPRQIRLAKPELAGAGKTGRSGRRVTFGLGLAQ